MVRHCVHTSRHALVMSTDVLWRLTNCRFIIIFIIIIIINIIISCTLMEFTIRTLLQVHI